MERGGSNSGIPGGLCHLAFRRTDSSKDSACSYILVLIFFGFMAIGIKKEYQKEDQGK